uniref:Secreted protein n=1 Tax=Populus trichocarpa TaxID=3694 RepID=A0A2K1Z6I1_POPTR
MSTAFLLFLLSRSTIDGGTAKIVFSFYIAGFSMDPFSSEPCNRLECRRRLPCQIIFHELERTTASAIK